LERRREFGHEGKLEVVDNVGQLRISSDEGGDRGIENVVKCNISRHINNSRIASMTSSGSLI